MDVPAFWLRFHNFGSSRPAVHMRDGNNPWVHGHAADPFLALLIAVLIGAMLAGVTLLFR
jgi:hypothetical protein